PGLGFAAFRAHVAEGRVAQTPGGPPCDPSELHIFADGGLLAGALHSAGIPPFWLDLAQVDHFQGLLVDANLDPDRIALQATVDVPQRSIYDFIALDGPRRLDRYLPADSLGVADVRLNLPGLVNYSVTLAERGYLGGKAQQAALLAGPLLNMTRLPDALGYELAASLAPSEDRTYLAWSFATPWRPPFSLKEIAQVAVLAGAPFDGPLTYRGEQMLLPRFKAHMEFRYPVIVECPGAGTPAPGANKPAGSPAPPPENTLLIAANGWNLGDVLDVKQGRVPNLANAAGFQHAMAEQADQAAVQVYANLTQGFGYAYVSLLAELYGLPIGGVPLEEGQLPRSEAFGPLGDLWVSIGRQKLPPPSGIAGPPPSNGSSPQASGGAEKSASPDPGKSRLRCRIVWKME
ncbi:MAG: hypothetical protein ACREJ2_09900, partial [Planctomycetota bacterium]